VNYKVFFLKIANFDLALEYACLGWFWRGY